MPKNKAEKKVAPQRGMEDLKFPECEDQRESVDGATKAAIGLLDEEIKAMDMYAGVKRDERVENEGSNIELDRPPQQSRIGSKTTQYDALRQLGFNAKHCKRLATFSRLSKLTGLVDGTQVHTNTQLKGACATYVGVLPPYLSLHTHTHTYTHKHTYTHTYTHIPTHIHL